jgi:uncharacterized protein (DUF58 family)
VISPTIVAEPKFSPAAPVGRFSFGLTRRALLLLLAGTLWFVPAFFVRRFVWGVVLWDATVLLFALIDGWLLPAPRLIEARRSWISAPALGSASEVELSLLHRGGRLLLCRLMDDLPAAFLEVPQWLELTAYPGIPATLRYAFTPRERGDHPAGKLYLRFLARNRQLELQLRKQRQRGLGRDFETLRDYLDGDDLRDVCWKASARRGALITKQYQTERSQAVWLLLDAGRLLQARVGGYTKLDYATATALAMSQLALASGDRVGLLAYGRETQQLIAPRRGGAHLRQILDALALVHGETAEADHLRATVTLNRLQPRRSLVLWLTDPAETSMQPEVAEGAAQLMRRHLVLFVAIEQRDLRKIAAMRPENQQQMFAGAAAQEMVHWRELLLARLRQRGALTLETYPEEMTSLVLNRYLEIKEKALL